MHARSLVRKRKKVTFANSGSTGICKRSTGLYWKLLSLGTHSTSRRVDVLSGSFRVRAIAGKKKSYVYSLPVGWKSVKESGVVEQSVIRALLFPHQWRDGLPLVGEYKDFR